MVTGLSDLLDLNRFRLERNLTYRELAALVGVKPKNLHRLLNSVNPVMHDRTLHQIRAFLDRVRREAA